MPAFPATPPTLPHSTSSPSLSSPKPLSVPKNYHPYAIQTTASSVLTRSNSSPSQPLSAYRHKPSRSMSSLAHPGSPPVEEPASDSAWRKDKRDRERTKSMDMSTPSRGGLRRSDKMGSFPSLRDEDMRFAEEKLREPTLPTNPRAWTPADLAAYLEWHLRTGGIDGQGQTLPPRLVEDIKSWVFRSQVNGRVFLKGSEEEWSTSSRPPPFMPLLLAMSRKLRRTSLQGRMRTSMSDASALIGTPGEQSALGAASVLLEEEEDFDDDSQEMSGVRRMAQSLETRSSASEASGDEGDHRAALQPQWTGGSSSGNGHRPIIKREYTGGSSASAKAVGPLVEEALKRFESRDSHGGLADSEASPMVKHEFLPADVEEPTEPEEAGPGSTVKGAPAMLSGHLLATETSPPPPYASPYLDSSPQSSPALVVQPGSTSALTLTPVARVAPSSVTPTPDRPNLHTDDVSTTDLALQSLSGPSPPPLAPQEQVAPSSPHMTNMQNHRLSGSDPYAALRRSSSSSSGAGKRLPTLSTIRRAQGNAGLAAGDDDSGVVEMSPTEFVEMLSTARRVTIRPGPARVSDIFLPSGAEGPTEKEKEMEKTVQDLMSRIKELETRLESVENKSGDTTPASQPSRSVSPTAITRPSSPILAMLPESVLESFGFSFGQDGDAMPRRVRELPAYLFLMGVGVGAVMVRVLLGRTR